MYTVFWSVVGTMLASAGMFGVIHYGFELSLQETTISIVAVIIVVVVIMRIVCRIGFLVANITATFLVVAVAGVATFSIFTFISVVSFIIGIASIISIGVVFSKEKSLPYWRVLGSYAVEGIGLYIAFSLLPSSPWLAVLTVAATIASVAVICFVSVRRCAVVDPSGTEASSSQGGA